MKFWRKILLKIIHCDARQKTLLNKPKSKKYINDFKFYFKYDWETTTYSVHMLINGFLSIKLSSYSISMSPRCLWRNKKIERIEMIWFFFQLTRSLRQRVWQRKTTESIGSSWMFWSLNLDQS